MQGYMQSEVIPKPTARDWQRIEEGFRKRWHFPNCVGGNMSPSAPPSQEVCSCNYKGYFSLVLLALVDANYRLWRIWFKLRQKCVLIFQLWEKVHEQETSHPWPKMFTQLSTTRSIASCNSSWWSISLTLFTNETLPQKRRMHNTTWWVYIQL